MAGRLVTILVTLEEDHGGKATPVPAPSTLCNLISEAPIMADNPAVCGPKAAEVRVFGRRKIERQAAWEREALEGAGAYLLAGVAGDDRRIDAAIARVDDGALRYGIVALAQCAVSALAMERGVSPEAVMQSLIESVST